MYQRDSSGNGGEVIMEVQQQKKRSGVKFNVIDFLIVVIALLCILSLVARYTNVLEKIGVSEQMQQYEVTFAIKDLRYTTPNFFHINDKVYLKDGKQTYMGTLLNREIGSTDALTITLSSRYIQEETGFISAYYEENTLVDVTGRMLCMGTVNEEGYFLLGGDLYLAEGQKLAVYTDLVDFELTVTGITRTYT